MIVTALVNLRPGAQWTIDSESYEGINWLDSSQTKPSREELEQEIQRLTSQEPTRIALEKRLRAYQLESDSLFFKWQAGEASEEDWKAKRAEIKARYPKGENVNE